MKAEWRGQLMIKKGIGSACGILGKCKTKADKRCGQTGIYKKSHQNFSDARIVKVDAGKNNRKGKQAEFLFEFETTCFFVVISPNF